MGDTIEIRPGLWLVDLEGFNSTIRAVSEADGLQHDLMLASLFVRRLTIPDLHEMAKGVAWWRREHPSAFVHREGCEPQAVIPRPEKPRRHQGRIVRSRKGRNIEQSRSLHE